jgi:hypothetical protein
MIRCTEVRPICSRRAISALLRSARYSFLTCSECSAAVIGRPSRFPVCRAYSNPARVRSRRPPFSNSAKMAGRPAIARPAAVVRSRASVTPPPVKPGGLLPSRHHAALHFLLPCLALRPIVAPTPRQTPFGKQSRSGRLRRSPPTAIRVSLG